MSKKIESPKNINLNLKSSAKDIKQVFGKITKKLFVQYYKTLALSNDNITNKIMTNHIKKIEAEQKNDAKLLKKLLKESEQYYNNLEKLKIKDEKLKIKERQKKEKVDKIIDTNIFIKPFGDDAFMEQPQNKVYIIKELLGRYKGETISISSILDKNKNDIYYKLIIEVPNLPTKQFTKWISNNAIYKFYDNGSEGSIQ